VSRDETTQSFSAQKQERKKEKLVKRKMMQDEGVA